MTTEEKIRLAYTDLAREPGDFIHISDLADTLAGQVTQYQLADTLVGMYRKQEVNLVPQADQESLTERQRQGAIWCGGNYKHRMSMRAFAL